MPPLLQKPISVALMDRSPLTLTGLSCFISSLNVPSEIIIQETSVMAVSEKMSNQSVDILITELSGFDEKIAQSCEILLNLCINLPTSRIVIYTHSQKGEELYKFLNLSNISVISRKDDLRMVGEFIIRIFNGERVLSPLIGTYLARIPSDGTSNLYNLTRCENDVLTALFSGMSLTEIAELQHRSIKTISAHKCNAMRKLRVKNDSELFSLRKKIIQQFVYN